MWKVKGTLIIYFDEFIYGGTCAFISLRHNIHSMLINVKVIYWLLTFPKTMVNILTKPFF
jgi:hypothetical protein